MGLLLASFGAHACWNLQPWLVKPFEPTSWKGKYTFSVVYAEINLAIHFMAFVIKVIKRSRDGSDDNGLHKAKTYAGSHQEYESRIYNNFLAPI